MDNEQPVNLSEFPAGLIEAEIEDNCIDHGVRGILKHDDILKMISLYREEDKQARVFGRFQHLTGLVFKVFSRRVHVIKPFEVNMRDYCVIERLDPHPRNPDAVLWVAFDRMGNYYVVDELYTKVVGEEELAFRIKNKAQQYRVIDRRADPSAWVEDQHNKSKESLARRLQRFGLNYLHATKKRTIANKRIEDYLNYQEQGGQMIRNPRLHIFDTCVRTIWELEHWQYNEYTGKAAEKHNPSEKPQDKDDHMMENLGRALLDDIGFRIMEMRNASFGGGTFETQTPNLDPY